jgi:hypothetical protein
MDTATSELIRLDMRMTLMSFGKYGVARAKWFDPEVQRELYIKVATLRSTLTGREKIGRLGANSAAILLNVMIGKRFIKDNGAFVGWWILNQSVSLILMIDDRRGLTRSRQ